MPFDREIKESHPAWVCGLKQNIIAQMHPTQSSHPAWVCGLKPLSPDMFKLRYGHTLRGCVD